MPINNELLIVIFSLNFVGLVLSYSYGSSKGLRQTTQRTATMYNVRQYSVKQYGQHFITADDLKDPTKVELTRFTQLVKVFSASGKLVKEYKVK